MRIAVSSTQCNGKSTFVQSFRNIWPMYKTPKKTYRDIIKEKNITLNRQGTQESQKIILDALIDQAIESASEEKVIHDRCVLDNLAYTLWLAEHGKITDEKFIADSINLTRETIKMYDIILFLPISEKSPVYFEESENRDLDLKYRQEINNIFLGFESSYIDHEGIIFPLEDSPALIRIEGDEEHGEKTDIMRNYIDDDGNFITTDEPLVKLLDDAIEENEMLRNLVDQITE